ncbi:MAG: hypothetical protein ABSA85_02560 [Terracidiphilus sp.]|jgi:hypothetical protein
MNGAQLLRPCDTNDWATCLEFFRMMEFPVSSEIGGSTMMGYIVGFALILVPFTAFAQVGVEHCENWCKLNQPECHKLRSDVYLDVSHFQNGDCWSEFAGETSGSRLTRPAALEKSLQEIELAASDAAWAKKQGAELPLGIGFRQMLLGHELLRSKDLSSAAKWLDEAGTTYLQILNTEDGAHLSRDQLIRIAVGLIRCGRPVESLAALRRLDSKDGERLYLSSEVFLHIGERRLAAEGFQDWVHLGCASDFPLLTEDEIGPVWGLAYPTKSLTESQCGELPADTWSEIKTLDEQFGIPNNLPAQNEPPTLLRTFGR